MIAHGVIAATSRFTVPSDHAPIHAFMPFASTLPSDAVADVLVPECRQFNETLWIYGAQAPIYPFIAGCIGCGDLKIALPSVYNLRARGIVG